ncbi:hypothetical protein CHELA1G11_10123 [Hyphomicrobiales bacterium]|nr:hypothetical protein CHELA1G11_10123 [Hyphomicrobiales bacterium]CAH1676905.1 hypothetical protein CHELA1G2_14186 [Hyphomicrobiales bacterium]
MNSKNFSSSNSRDDIRSEIIAATIDVLVREGIVGATFRRIAATAGVSAGAVQHHFPTRLQLLYETLDDVFLHLGRTLVSFEFSSDIEARVQQVIDVLWDFYGGQNYLAAQVILLGSRLNLTKDRVIQRRSYREMDRLFGEAWERIVGGSAIDAKAGYPLLRLLLSTMRGMAIIAVHRRLADFADVQLSILAGLIREALISGKIPAAGNFELKVDSAVACAGTGIAPFGKHGENPLGIADALFPL